MKNSEPIEKESPTTGLDSHDPPTGQNQPANLEEESGSSGEIPLPLFYQNIEILSEKLHGDISVKDNGDMSFAETEYVVLLANEFADAQRDYPIIFSGGEDGMAFAFVGGPGGENLFLDDNGHWAAERYVPAYVRRYPFISARIGESENWAMCIDRDAPCVTEGDIRPLYTNGQPSDVLREARDFSQKYLLAEQSTKAFCRTLHDYDLLSEGSVTLSLEGGKQHRYSGLFMIDRDKFDALDRNVLEEWYQKGWLDAVYAHFMSQGAWEVIRNRVSGG